MWFENIWCDLTIIVDNTQSDEIIKMTMNVIWDTIRMIEQSCSFVSWYVWNFCRGKSYVQTIHSKYIISNAIPRDILTTWSRHHNLKRSTIRQPIPSATMTVKHLWRTATTCGCGRGFLVKLCFCTKRWSCFASFQAP